MVVSSRWTSTRRKEKDAADTRRSSAGSARAGTALPAGIRRRGRERAPPGPARAGHESNELEFYGGGFAADRAVGDRIGSHRGRPLLRSRRPRRRFTPGAGAAAGRDGGSGAAFRGVHRSVGRGSGSASAGGRPSDSDAGCVSARPRPGADRAGVRGRRRRSAAESGRLTPAANYEDLVTKPRASGQGWLQFVRSRPSGASSGEAPVALGAAVSARGGGAGRPEAHLRVGITVPRSCRMAPPFAWPPVSARGTTTRRFRHRERPTAMRTPFDRRRES